MRQEDYRRFAQSGGKVCSGIADGNDDVAGFDQCRQTVNIVLVIDIVQMGDVDTRIGFNCSSLILSIAILQVDELNAGYLQ